MQKLHYLFCGSSLYMYSAQSTFHFLPLFMSAVTYRRDRSMREIYDERFLPERSVSVCD